MNKILIFNSPSAMVGLLSDSIEELKRTRNVDCEVMITEDEKTAFDNVDDADIVIVNNDTLPGKRVLNELWRVGCWIILTSVRQTPSIEIPRRGLLKFIQGPPFDLKGFQETILQWCTTSNHKPVAAGS